MEALGPLGIWSRQLRYGDPAESLEAAAELDELGFDALWIPDVGAPVLDTVEALLAATRGAAVATGILNVWMHDPVEVAARHALLDERHPGRFLLGLGIGHAPLVDARQPGRYRRPLATMRAYLDSLDGHAPAGTAPARVLAALGPKMVALAGERTLGVHPYLVPVEHTRGVRAALGRDRVVAVALSVVLEPDRERARRIARVDLQPYLGLPNYTNTWRRLGYGDADLARGSDRLLDDLYAYGPPERVAERIADHRRAGADHVCLRVVTGRPDDAEHLPRAEWRVLAEALLG
ncbi:MAG TPA: TIGR03620 family F420-dependent LLM class oxidoreductase [Gaiellaceae bacterium]|nr:TIGR03620 family F420-dependent LLM class oxidoreductase [Gaiellaceae bacterium]